MITETKINICLENAFLMQKTYHIGQKDLINILMEIHKAAVYFKDVLFVVLGINRR